MNKKKLEQELKKYNNNDEANKKLNIGAAMYGFSDPAFQDETADSYGDGPGNDPHSNTFGPGWEEDVAPSKSQTDSKGRTKKPRALAIGWHKRTDTLVVVFRPPGITKQGTYTVTGAPPWVYYDDVSEEMWEELRGYHSTGEWLKYSGVEANNYARVPGDNKEGLASVIAGKLSEK